MVRVRFAPSPTGTLHVGNALSAVANRRIGDWLLLRLDDTDAARNVAGGEDAIIDDLRWLGQALGRVRDLDVFHAYINGELTRVKAAGRSAEVEQKEVETWLAKHRPDAGE